MTDAVVVLVTGSSRDELVRLGRVLVEERLIACANVVEPITSVYRWEGEVREDVEALAILKTTADAAAALADRVVELHPYDVPEVLVLDVSGGGAPYLDWVRTSVARPASGS